ncbi:MAG: hypothetical protein ABI416_11490 [Ginsengibacter sp.]
MNFNLTQIPGRNIKPGSAGIMTAMDKGLSVEEAKYFMSASHTYVDVINWDLALLLCNSKSCWEASGVPFI